MGDPPVTRIAIVSTSLSPRSRSRILCQHAVGYARRQRLDAALLDLRDHRVLPYGEEDSRGLETISTELGAAAGIIIGFPLYNFNMNATLKALLERCGSCFEEKVVGIMSAAGGRSSYMGVMSIVQSLILDYRSWIVPRYVYATGEDFADGEIVSEEVCQRVEELVEATRRAACALVGPPCPRGS
ncbi:MAG: NAD(P)H-dependent oxidoreductase [Candidatus Latescibacterota bacterium]